MKPELPSCVAVVGLGYVGLPLACAFSRIVPTIAFDVDRDRIRDLQNGHDRNHEIGSEALKSENLCLTDDPAALCQATFTIVTVPTPVDKAKRPELSHLIDASRLVGQSLKAKLSARGSASPSRASMPLMGPPIVVYESTVYPGCTEEVCIPALEQESGLKAGREFKVGYSPERTNPGDSEHTLDRVVKIVAAQDQETTEVLAETYGLVVKVGVHKAPDIRTAEAAKVIENVQRDLNIALMNELSLLFHRLDVDTSEVLKAARTKWNFLPFEPGLVGGHCIPVDPYYLTHKAQEVGYLPEVILAGRRINDSMGPYVAGETVKLLIRAGKAVKSASVLVLGVTFKEDVRDWRNTQVMGLVRELESFGIDVTVYDPLVSEDDLERLGLKTTHGDPFHEAEVYDAVILTVPHKSLREKQVEAYLGLLKDEGERGVLVDVKGVLREGARNSGVLYWSL